MQLRLKHYKDDVYPEFAEGDARLLGEPPNMTCYGILFGGLPECIDMQKKILHAVNSHAALVEALSKLMMMIDFEYPYGKEVLQKAQAEKGVS